MTLDSVKNFISQSVDTFFIAAGCAVRSNIVEWCPITGYIFFAANTDICIVDADKSLIHKNESKFRIAAAVPAHSSSIVLLKLAQIGPERISGNSILCSSSSVGEIKIWQVSSTDISLTCLKYISNLETCTTALVAYFYRSDANFQGIIAYSQYDRMEYLKIDSENSGHESTTALYFSSFVISAEIFVAVEFFLLFVGFSNGCIEIFYQDSKKEFQRACLIKSTQIQWIRSLAVKKSPNPDELFFLSASYDNCIKIWKFEYSTKFGENSCSDFSFCFNDTSEEKILAKLDTVLGGTEKQFRSLRWDINLASPLRLLSSSNSNVIIWEYQPSDNFWIARHRIGEIGGDDPGYFGALFSPDSSRVLFHNYFGAFDLWQLDNQNASPQIFPISGHIGPVSDLSWDQSGAYMLSTSLDKTTRIFAPYSNGFIELARPQIHGHEINCISSISSSIFVSGGEEKIFRVFQATSPFFENLKNISDISNVNEGTEKVSQTLVALSELGLSNKEVSLKENFSLSGVTYEDMIFHDPPSHEQLTRFTLFPEIHKLYGHGFEVFAVAANHSGSLIATSCKASHIEHAVILIWDTKECQIRSTLKEHKLTVTQLSFSYDDRWLLSVSRDRSWILFLNFGENSQADYRIHCVGDKNVYGHTRIIWAGAWAPDSSHFVTASRDKMLKIWRIDDISLQVSLKSNYCDQNPLTAVDIAPEIVKENFIIVTGDETGIIKIFCFDSKTSKLNNICHLSQSLHHSARITKIRFRPGDRYKTNETNLIEFASSCESHLIKMHRIFINE